LPARQLRNILADFERETRACRRLADDAFRWSLATAAPRITAKRREWLVELAYLRMYLGWEAFLEESFIAYLMGMRAPSGRAPHRFTLPPDLKSAREWVVPEGRQYAAWDDVRVGNRALRFFRSGHPFAAVLKSNQNFLEDAKKIRNAVAHESINAREKFATVARKQLGGVLPPNLTVGAFLGTVIPGLTPPQSFLEFYLDRLEFMAGRIIPS
jgi:hypothetical protein